MKNKWIKISVSKHVGRLYTRLTVDWQFDKYIVECKSNNYWVISKHGQFVKSFRTCKSAKEFVEKKIQNEQ